MKSNNPAENYCRDIFKGGVLKYDKHITTCNIHHDIREHRDSSGQDLCWHHPKLWGLLPEKPDDKILVPDWPEFMKGCIKYRTSLDNLTKQDY